MNQKRKELCFRVAHHDGTGMYAMFRNDLTNIVEGEVLTKHPPPWADDKLCSAWDALYNDEIANEYRQYYFGFSSMEQLRRWLFNSELNQKMHEAGLRIHIYQTDDYHMGDTQMVFRKETAILIGRADLI